MSTICGEKTEVYSRVCGYFRPVSNWNRGKREEFRDRREFAVPAKPSFQTAVPPKKTAE